MSVRIGIDARRYGHAGRGQERYVRSLVRALAAGNGDHEYVLLGNGPARSAETPGSRVSFSPAGRRLRLQYRARFGALRRLLVRDLDLVHFPLADGWYSRVAPSVVTIHDLSVLRYPDVYFREAAAERRERWHLMTVAGCADAVIAVSEATRRDVVALLDVPSERVTVVPHGVDAVFRPVRDVRALADLRRRYGLPARYALFVGGTDFKKNVARVVAGFALARERGGLPHGLVLAGPLQRDGNPFFEAAREQAAAARVSERVLWAGYLPDADLPALYSGADVLVFPSFWEGFGFPVLEAMACGTPVVTAKESATAEIAGEAAVLVDPLDCEAIASGILRAIEEGKDGPLVRAGLRRAADYTWERTAARTVEVYESVAAGRPGGEVRA